MGKKTPKYRIDCDVPGLQLSGASGIFGDGASILPPGSFISVPAGTPGWPRRCCTPTNDAAIAEFAVQAKREEARWREALAKGEDPDGTMLERCQSGHVLTKDEVEAIIKKVKNRLGPAKRPPALTQNTRAKPIDPSTLSVNAAPAPVKKAADDDDDDEDDVPAVRASSGP